MAGAALQAGASGSGRSMRKAAACRGSRSSPPSCAASYGARACRATNCAWKPGPAAPQSWPSGAGASGPAPLPVAGRRDRPDRTRRPCLARPGRVPASPCPYRPREQATAIPIGPPPIGSPRMGLPGPDPMQGASPAARPVRPHVDNLVYIPVHDRIRDSYYRRQRFVLSKLSLPVWLGWWCLARWG